MTVEPSPNATVAVGAARFGNSLPLMLIAGPCALESREHALEMVSALKEIAGKVGIGLVYKTSFDKANRTSAKSNRGIGLDDALPIFSELREKFGVPILTDVHEPQHPGQVVDGHVGPGNCLPLRRLSARGAPQSADGKASQQNCPHGGSSGEIAPARTRRWRPPFRARPFG